MKKKVLLAALAAAAVAVPAIACDAMDGFSCSNQCPLAQQANTHRSVGREAPAVRAALAVQVERNLSRI